MGDLEFCGVTGQGGGTREARRTYEREVGLIVESDGRQKARGGEESS